MSSRGSSRSASCRWATPRRNLQPFLQPISRDGPTSPGPAISGSSLSAAHSSLGAGRAEAVWLLFHEVGTDLADHSILIAGAARTTDAADDLAVFNKRKSAGARRERWIERGDVAVPGLKGIEKQAGFAAEASRRAGLVGGKRKRPHFGLFPPLQH